MNADSAERGKLLDIRKILCSSRRTLITKKVTETNHGNG